jgi:hypothetical protein
VIVFIHGTAAFRQYFSKQVGRPAPCKRKREAAALHVLNVLWKQEPPSSPSSSTSLGVE